MLIQRNIPLHDKNWFGTGGNADYFCAPQTEADFTAAISYALIHNLPVTVLGEGANLLISDEGIVGLVIRPNLSQISLDDIRNTITAGAGVAMQQVIDACLDHGFIGLEDFSGIPGHMGGCVYINIHYFEYLLSHFLVEARVINRFTGQIMTVDCAWFNFGYNQSTLQEGTYFLVSVTLQVKKADPVQVAYARGRRDEIVRHRSRRYPQARTCGSFFRNFHEDELPFAINGKKIPFVAYYLDKVGVKGELRIGNAVVSHLHANMLVTLPDATSTDVINLARRMQELVFEKFGIILQAECQFIGFKEHPLHYDLKSHPAKSSADNQPSIEP